MISSSAFCYSGYHQRSVGLLVVRRCFVSSTWLSTPIKATTTTTIKNCNYFNRWTQRPALVSQLSSWCKRPKTVRFSTNFTTATTTSTTSTSTTTTKLLHHEEIDSSSFSHSSFTSTSSPWVSVWQLRDEHHGRCRMIYLVGAIHGFAETALLACQIIQTVQPQAVMVELDLDRVMSYPLERIPLPRPTMEHHEEEEEDKVETKKNEGLRSYSHNNNNNNNRTQEDSVTWMYYQADDDENNSAPSFKETNFKSNQQTISFSRKATTATPSKNNSIMKQRQRYEVGDEFFWALQVGQEQGAVLVLGDIPDTTWHLTWRYLYLAFRYPRRFWIPTSIWDKLSAIVEVFQFFRRILRRHKQYQRQLRNNYNNQGSSPTTATFATMEIDGQVVLMLGDTPAETQEQSRRICRLHERLAPLNHHLTVHVRNVHMAACLHSLNQLPIIVAVVGLGHVDGIEEILQQQYRWKRHTPINNHDGK